MMSWQGEDARMELGNYGDFSKKQPELPHGPWAHLGFTSITSGQSGQQITDGTRVPVP
jgi:hypothetical protein